MCAIIGALTWEQYGTDHTLEAIYHRSHQRGRDGRGVVRVMSPYGIEFQHKDVTRMGAIPMPLILPPTYGKPTITLINLRAEPTTEFVANKNESDQQPYTFWNWSMVHNGTIANDKELRHDIGLDTPIDSAAIVERLVFHDVEPDHFNVFKRAVKDLKGSYAILAVNHRESDRIYVAANYRPVWYIETEVGLYFASARDYFPPGYPPTMIEPYTVAMFWRSETQVNYVMEPLERKRAPGPTRALVVCSGGLDSVVAATVAQRRLGYEITLLHFLYGTRSEELESNAVRAVAKELDCLVHFMSMRIYEKQDSNLLQKDSQFAGGEAGAEFAHEWVPARNLVMLAMATAYAEAKGFDKIILGNNLEEAGAYPDNEPEFIARFNDILPFAVADGKKVTVEMPVGNLMKHEIVALGHEVGAPMHLTWSCYRNGEKHCGTCGPCYMRRKAFEINNLLEVIEYALPLHENLWP